jgi:hypothetical protein
MKLIKMLCLAAFAAAATAAFAPSAMAADTALCKSHPATDACPAGERYTSTHLALVAGTQYKLEGAFPHTLILCLGLLVQATLGGLANPQTINGNVTYSNCGTNAVHNNCTVTELEAFSGTVLWTLLNLGELKAGAVKPGITLFKCIGTECEYKSVESGHFSGASATTGKGRVNIKFGTLEKLGGGILCPAQLEITEGLLEALADTYVMK